ncbi:hypothetical protein C2G38_2106544 [Gigaspora rosea]|uniref:Uncharacterized protein n=1 Tax=Gigaspora rosea TaxID=44941 RepID=A0A397UN99_9GLOM|nr:hypothetical protein C2G38_2106544 [Gigaspora rosea]
MTQKPEITFLCNIKHFDLLKNYTWHCNKKEKNNTFYINTTIKKENKWKLIQFH